MKIRFLKNVTAPQEHMEYCGDGCCSWPEFGDEFFMEGEEADPEEPCQRINLEGLTYKEDYEIIEYP